MKIIILLFIMFCLGWLGLQARGQSGPPLVTPTVAENATAVNDPKVDSTPKPDDKPKSDDKPKTDVAPKVDAATTSDPPAKSAPPAKSDATVAHGVLALAP